MSSALGSMQQIPLVMEVSSLFKLLSDQQQTTELRSWITTDNEIIGTIQKTVMLTEPIQIPKSFRVSYNYPNPFNNSTAFDVDVPKSGCLTAKIFNLQGKLVQVLAHDSPIITGHHRLVWDGASQSGDPVGSGIYFCKIIYGTEQRVLKFTLIKWLGQSKIVTYI